MIELFGKEIHDCDELISAVLDEITLDDIADEYGIRKSIDQDWIHDKYCDYFDEEEYEKFEKMLYSEDYGDIELDFSDPHQEARDFYYSTRGC